MNARSVSRMSVGQWDAAAAPLAVGAVRGGLRCWCLGQQQQQQYANRARLMSLPGAAAHWGGW
jgi:hypothetical protein